MDFICGAFTFNPFPPKKTKFAASDVTFNLISRLNGKNVENRKKNSRTLKNLKS